MKFYIETYGCSRNFADSEHIAGVLSAEHEQVESEKDADLIVINTCTVKKPTELKILKRVKELRHKKLIIAGCMPEVQLEELKKVAPNAEFWGVKHEEVLDGPVIRTNKIIGIVPISSGCLGNCTYCIVKNARGPLKSYAPEKIIKSVEQFIQDGCKEIWITAQDTAAYGFDINSNLAELLTKVCAVHGDFKVRVGMMNPNHVLKIQDELIGAFKSEKLFKFLHLPVQSGNDQVLKDMNRQYSVEEFKQIVERFRKEFPGFAISTDVIVGYPTETEAQFQDTLDLIKEIEPDDINISRFGKRPGTEAEKLKEHEEVVKKNRSSKLTDLAKEVRQKRNNTWLGWTGSVLIDEESQGRNYAYKQIIIEGKIGETKQVEIKKATPFYLLT
ncbi:MAG: tRNA (N(6)-L-threonylcarbamoyladenosine(37)-C(2))-methylthiotransferase [archaeon]